MANEVTRLRLPRRQGRWRRAAVLLSAVTVLVSGSLPAAGSARAGLAAADEGTLHISAVFDDGSALPDAALVRINGTVAGTTDGSGSATVTWPAGPAEVAVVLPSLAAGSASATVVAGGTTDVHVVLQDGEGVHEPSTLTMDELANGGLDMATPSVTLRFLRAPDASAIPVAFVQLVTVATAGDDEQDLTSLFRVGADGAVVAADPAALRARLAALHSDTVSLHVEAVDATGLSYAGTMSFVRGLARVALVLQAPPSKPDLAVSSVEVAVRFGSRDRTVTTDATGRVVLDQVPTGPFGVSAAVQADGQWFNAIADLTMAAGSHTLTVPLRATADVLAGVAPWSLAAGLAASGAQERAAGRGTGRTPTVDATAAAALQPGYAVVTSAAQDVPQVRVGTALVPKGTSDIVLAYKVESREYPHFVLPQSKYNDVWSVTVLGPSGQILYTISRAVNSQLETPPIWRSDPFLGGITGQIRQELNITALTANADIALTLVVTSTNIGASGGATKVDASLGAFAPTLSVRAIRPDRVPQPAAGRSDRFSIPRTGGTNTFQRTLDIDYSHAANVEITRIRVDLVNGSNSLLQTVVNVPITDPAVTVVDADTLRVRVTYDGGTLSTIAGVPPPTDLIRYQVTLTGRRSDGATGNSSPLLSADFRALWRMPDGFDRYSVREPGGDDWTSRATWNWLSVNRALVTRINDISGEHARDLGHLTHLEGRDLDLYHVYHFPNNPGFNGTVNFYRLAEDTRAAMAGNAEARARVAAWATQTRQRFDALIANADTVRIYYAIGRAMPGRTGVPALGRGWARALLENGSYTTAAGEQVNLGIGAWANAGHDKMRYNEVHDNHFHLTLAA
ncbi:hypothetical protein E1193_12875 [Micromonospora sp. KC606]|uniref:hypothetical protein n=1 Tax=Micromonospora sp. KC606 TaxID=2530379 RepID=UPI0010477B77|nr:hypothetical protein [Micromonospora sp. KC606]TDC82089.1 hypothetical protein E1193_12875 [Micromonospora sp. KC606]